MNKNRLTVALCALAMTALTASAQKTKKADLFPLGNYEELTDTKPHDSDAAWAKLVQPTQLSWASIDTRYRRLDIPKVKQQNMVSLKAWRGERVNAQALLWTNVDLDDVQITVSDLRSGNSVIPASALRTNFVRYVMTDELNKDGSGCGYRNPADWDSSVVADVLDINKTLPVRRNTTQPVWANVWVPQDAKPGNYTAQITVSGKNMKPMSLQLKLQVINRTLPSPQQWTTNLDLWQNPYAVARYYKVPLWSKAHFDAMRPIMKMLADAGQYSITTSIMHKPWNGQTEDHYDSMVAGTYKSQYRHCAPYITTVGFNYHPIKQIVIKGEYAYRAFKKPNNKGLSSDSPLYVQSFNNEPSISLSIAYQGWFLK